MNYRNLNNICSDGVKYMYINSTITKLDISWNNISFNICNYKTNLNRHNNYLKIKPFIMHFIKTDSNHLLNHK